MVLLMSSYLIEYYRYRIILFTLRPSHRILGRRKNREIEQRKSPLNLEEWTREACRDQDGLDYNPYRSSRFALSLDSRVQPSHSTAGFTRKILCESILEILRIAAFPQNELSLKSSGYCFLSPS